MANRSFVRPVLTAVVLLAFAGCATKPQMTEKMPPRPSPAAASVGAEPRAVSKAPGWSDTQVTASAKYVILRGTLPEAKGMLAFLADGEALRAGKVTLTREQEDEALAALTRITGEKVRSTPQATVASGNPARMRIEAPRLVDGREHSSPVVITVGGTRLEPSPDIAVELDVFPRTSVDGLLQVNADVQVETFKGFVEYKGKTVSAGGSGPVTAPDVFYQPIFETVLAKIDTRMVSGGVVAMRVDRRVISSGPLGMAIDAVKRGNLTGSEILLVFLTAETSPAKR